MFKNLIIYRIADGWSTSAAEVAEALAKEPFLPCAPTQPLSVGWAPPRGIENGTLVEAVDGQWLLKLKREQRLLPSTVVAARVEELAAQVEEQTGRKPGKKRLIELKEQAIHDLLPKTLTRQSHVNVWLAADIGLLAIDSTSDARLDEICALLIRAWPGLTISNLQTKTAPAALMAQWLLDGDTDYSGFSLGGETELKAADGTKSTVRYTRHSLDRSEVVDHIKAGKAVQHLSLDFKERVAFTLTQGLRLKRISLLDLAYEGRSEAHGDEAFDADVALACGEIRLLVPALIDALDGERVQGEQA